MTQEELELNGLHPGIYMIPGWQWRPALCSPAVRGVLSAALSDVGKHEEPDKSNDGPQLKKFKTAGRPWCALACSEWLREGLLDSGGCPWGVLASALSIKEWGQKRGKIVPAAQPGDVFVIMRKEIDPVTKKEIEIHGHVGLIANVNADQSCFTLEGNAGNACRASRRLIKDFTAIVRPYA